ncbi:MAG: hypothetical protein WD625_03180 [Balneolales bacterium]
MSTLNELAPGNPALSTHPLVTNRRGQSGGCLLLVPAWVVQTAQGVALS